LAAAPYDLIGRSTSSTKVVSIPEEGSSNGVVLKVDVVVCIGHGAQAGVSHQVGIPPGVARCTLQGEDHTFDLSQILALQIERQNRTVVQREIDNVKVDDLGL
jgi:hypothetical protein